MSTDLFPLPLRAFEELFVHDDSPPDYPALFSIQFEFAGEIDAEAFRAGFARRDESTSECLKFG